MEHTRAETVAAFATALDRCDYPTAAALLAEDVEYVTGRQTLRGLAAIIASYREHDEWARRHLQSVRYESYVRVDGDRVVITFIDHLTHDGATHTYECEQLVWIDQRGLVARILHREVPGQRDAVEVFLDRMGVRRSLAVADTAKGEVR